jgi:hypothetical protein
MDLLGPSCNLSSRAHQGMQHHLSYDKHQTESEKTENNLTEHQQSPVPCCSNQETSKKVPQQRRAKALATPRLSAAPLKVDYAGSARLQSVHGRSDQHTDLARVAITFGVRFEDSAVRKSQEAKENASG